MIKKLLKRFGFIHKTDIDSATEILSNLVSFDFTPDPTFRKNERVIFSKIKEIEGVQEYLAETLARDIRRHFNAQNDIERATVKGAYARTLYLKAQLADEKPVKTALGKRSM